MTVRQAREGDLLRVLEIYGLAREYMKKEGNPTQWGEVYPPKELVEDDLNKNRLYAVEDEGRIYGVFALLKEGDDIYDSIDGAWLNELPHAAIHRVASSGERRGILAECVEFCKGFSENLKIDTHRDNKPMQGALKKQGFVYCGTVKLETGEELMAFQWSK